ncbi:MAG: PorT family protein [Deltaproteobacteria bacterium]|nr:PorT family protein [Deltaproteobacteria bacterium]
MKGNPAMAIQPTMIRCVLVCMVLSIVFGGTVALADTARAEPKVWVSAGIKGAIGGNRITEAEDKDIYVPDLGTEPAGDVLLPFMDGGGGTGGGGGVFGEVRILRQHLGLEMDVLFDANKTWYEVVAPDSVQMNYILKYAFIRLPLLLKVNLKTGATRFGFCIGPEFRFGLWARTDVEVTENEELVTGEELSAIRSTMSIRKRNDVGLTWGVSLGFDASPMEITLDLRFSHALSWPEEYGKRVKIEIRNRETLYAYQAGHSLDGRMLLGIAWGFSR